MPQRGDGAKKYTKRVAYAHRRLLTEEPEPLQTQPPDWRNPPASPDRDTIAGFEFLAGLDYRLRTIEVDVRLARQQLTLFDRNIDRRDKALEEMFKEFSQRLAALEAAMYLLPAIASRLGIPLR
jgi:hypothetical protein